MTDRVKLFRETFLDSATSMADIERADIAADVLTDAVETKLSILEDQLADLLSDVQVASRSLRRR
jgi:hypothetical protein